MAFDRTGGHVDRDRRGCVEVIAWPLVAHPWTAVARAPERKLRCRIVRPGDPYRAAARLPLIALRPRLATRLAGRRNGVRFPERLAAFHVVGSDKTTNAQFTTGGADHHLAVRHERRDRHVVAVPVVFDGRRPHLFTRSRIERDEHGFCRGEEHLATRQCHSPARAVQQHDVVGQRTLVAPERRAVLRIERDHLIPRRRDEHHAVVHDRRRLVAVGHARRHNPRGLQSRDVGRRHLVEWAVAPAVPGAPDHQPVARVGVLQPFVGNVLVVLQRGWHRCAWRWRSGRRRKPGLLCRRKRRRSQADEADDEECGEEQRDASHLTLSRTRLGR